MSSSLMPNSSMSKPLACHHIKESEISQINDSILDVGYFVVSGKLNQTAAAQACIQIGYHNWYWCNSQTIPEDFYYVSPKILGRIGPTYDDVSVNDACITDNH